MTIEAHALIAKPTAVVQLVGREHGPHDRIEKKALSGVRLRYNSESNEENLSSSHIHNCRQSGM